MSKRVKVYVKREYEVNEIRVLVVKDLADLLGKIKKFFKLEEFSLKKYGLQYLLFGIDEEWITFDTEEEFSWIEFKKDIAVSVRVVELGVSAKVPQRLWRECVDEKSGKLFYFNSLTHKVQWDTPENLDEVMDMSTFFEATEEDAIWSEHTDSKGKVFYYNAFTNESTYQKPSHLAQEKSEVVAEEVQIDEKKEQKKEVKDKTKEVEKKK